MTEKPTTRRESPKPEGAGSSTRSARGGQINDLAGIPEATRAVLSTAGFTKREELSAASDKELLAIKGIDLDALRKVRAVVPAEEAAAAAGAIAGKLGAIADAVLADRPEKDASGRKADR